MKVKDSSAFFACAFFGVIAIAFLACGNAVVGRTARLTRRAGETKQHWVSVTALLLVLFMTEMLISHAFLNIALSFLLIYLAVHVARRLLERKAFSIGWTVAIVAG